MDTPTPVRVFEKDLAMYRDALAQAIAPIQPTTPEQHEALAQVAEVLAMEARQAIAGDVQ